MREIGFDAVSRWLCAVLVGACFLGSASRVMAEGNAMFSQEQLKLPGKHLVIGISDDVF